ncbi:MAG: hypothetical protein RL591_1783, partial [Planctomycetota bacterium]
VVVDVETQSVALLDARSTPPLHISIAGGSGALPARFGEISALAVDASDARIYVADRVRHRVDVLVADWTKEGQQKLDLFIPRLARSMDLARILKAASAQKVGGLTRMPEVVDMLVGPAAGGTGQLLLLDRANRGIVRTDTSLSTVAFEPLPESVRWPEEFALGADGTMFVVDPVAGALFERHPDGTSWNVRTKLGDVALIRPSGVIAFGDVVVVADAARDACVVWDGTTARLVGERGGLDEQFFDPASIVSTDLGAIVIDRGNHRFQRFVKKGDDPFGWNMTGGLGRFFDRKRRGSPGYIAPTTAPTMAPTTAPKTAPATAPATAPTTAPTPKPAEPAPADAATFMQRETSREVPDQSSREVSSMDQRRSMQVVEPTNTSHANGVWR